MSISEDKFRDHIQKIVQETTPDSDRPLTLDELRQLAESMGVSESEWNLLLEKAEKSLEQAKGHLRVENYAEAIQSAEEATSINPYIKDGNAILAQSYYKLGSVDKNKQLLDKAVHYARMELKNDPMDSIAMNVLSAVEHENREGKFSKKLIMTIGVIVGAVVVIFLLLYTCKQTVDRNDIEQIVAEGEPADRKLERLLSDVEQLKANYTSAIERRNQDALELAGIIDDRRLKNEFMDAITDYDLESIDDSEQNFRIALAEVRSNYSIDERMQVRLDGGNNRINTEKKRYEQGVAAYNTAYDLHEDELTKDFDRIEE